MEDRQIGNLIVGNPQTVNLNITAVLMSDSCPSVQWAIDGIIIINGTNYTVTDSCWSSSITSSYTFTLTIANLTIETSGIYSAVFSYFTASASLRVFVTIPGENRWVA